MRFAVLLPVLIATAVALALPASAQGIKIHAECVTESGSLGLAVYTNSTYYVCIPFVEAEDETAGVLFSAHMPEPGRVVVVLEPGEQSVQYAVRVLDSNLELLGAASGVLVQRELVEIALSKSVSAAVVELYISGKLAKVFAVRLLEKAEKLSIDVSPQFATAVRILLLLLPAAPVLGLMLRSTPRAAAVMIFIAGWPLVMLSAWLAGLSGADEGLAYAIYGVAVVYSVLALVLWKKG